MRKAQARQGRRAAGRRAVGAAGAARVLLALALGGAAGCAPSAAGSPLVGRWSIDGVFPLVGPLTETWTLRADGTAEYAMTSSSCTGTITYGAIAWRSTDTTITFSGSPTCSGGVMCATDGSAAIVNIHCGSMDPPQTGTADYSLAPDRATLTLGTRTFTRVE